MHFYNEGLTQRFVQATSGNHEAVGRLMRRMALQIDLPAATEKIALIDGAPWIRNQIELHGEVTDIGLDFYHLRDYAQKTRRVVFGAPADAHDETPGEGKEGWFQYAFCDGARLHRKLWFQKHLKEQSRSRLRGTC